jgi:hypothetical protein
MSLMGSKPQEEQNSRMNPVQHGWPRVGQGTKHKGTTVEQDSMPIQPNWCRSRSVGVLMDWKIGVEN